MKDRLKWLVLIIVVIAVVASTRLGIVKTELAEVKAAFAKTENCERYYEKAEGYIKKFEKDRVSHPNVQSMEAGLRYLANISTAYSLLYQNCVARQNKR